MLPLIDTASMCEASTVPKKPVLQTALLVPKSLVLLASGVMLLLTARYCAANVVSTWFPPTVVPSPTYNFFVSVVNINSPAIGVIPVRSASVPRLICNAICNMLLTYIIVYLFRYEDCWSYYFRFFKKVLVRF